MERLTFRDSNGNVHATRVGYYDIIDKLEQYEELEEQGLLLKLPCKVGDTIYRIGTMCDFNEIPSEFNCDCVDCEECFYGTKLVIRESSAKEFYIRRFMDGTSKYDFLTKAEAEKVLAEMTCRNGEVICHTK